MNTGRILKSLSSPKAKFAIGFGLIFLVVLTTGVVPKETPDQYYQYDAVQYEVSDEEVIVTHVLTGRELETRVQPRPTPEELEEFSHDETALSAPEREAIEGGRTQTTENVSVRRVHSRSSENVSDGDIYEVNGEYYEIIETGYWEKGDGDEYACFMGYTENPSQSSFCDGPEAQWKPLDAILFTVGGYLAGGFLVVRGWSELSPYFFSQYPPDE